MFRMRTVTTEEAAEIFIEGLRADPAQEFRSWRRSRRDLSAPREGSVSGRTAWRADAVQAGRHATYLLPRTAARLRPVH
jgi:hypothetical protein